MFLRNRSISITVAALLLALAPIVSAQYPGATPPPADQKEGFDAIDVRTCRTWLTKLASREFEGRGTGQPGYQKAADYVAAEFKKMGLIPVGDQGTYFQYVPFARITTDPAKSSLRVGEKGKLFKAGDDLEFSFGAGDVDGEVVLVRARGGEAQLEKPEILDGRIALVVSRDTLRAPIRKQLAESKARAVLTVSSRAGRGPRDPQTRLVAASELSMQGLVSRELAGELLKELGLDEKLADVPEEEGVSTELGKLPVRLRLAGDREDILVPNVIGKLEGSDPVLKDEVVMLGSHLDHLGKVGKKIFPGADDDGSGSTALLAVAKAFSKNPVRPKRSIAFIAVCGEEMGLLGSSHYVEHPIFPIEKTVCELQMDMVGRNEHKPPKDYAKDNVDTIHLVGSKRISMDLHETILACNEHIKFVFEYDEESVYTRSDHYNFAKKGIPISFIFSGFHPDYHQETDTVDKINFEKIVSTARLYFLVAFEVANRQKRLKVDNGPFAN
ncbi:MAG: M20/M25/M40 family metallo-hydrolase [Planctomycetota bacterium]